jgi:serine/threonine protein phosphatase 1
MARERSRLVKRVSKNTKGRDIIVGDIHGCFTALAGALRGIGFDPEAGDRLFSVGDLVDRGPESLAVLEFLAQDFAHAVGGNHEAMASGYPGGDVDMGIYAANGGSWLIALDRETQREVAAVLGALPVAIELETDAGAVGIVHAECPFASWQEFTAALEDEEASEFRRDALMTAAQWSRTRIEIHDTSTISGVRAVVVGHTPLRESVTLGNTIYIDTMGWRGGKFTLLDAATLRPATRRAYA